MSALVSFGEHEASLLMLLAHDTLESVQPAKALSIEEILILEIWEANVNILPFVWPSLEPHHAVPRLELCQYIYLHMFRRLTMFWMAIKVAFVRMSMSNAPLALGFCE
jgi:hypothetical protein